MLAGTGWWFEPRLHAQHHLCVSPEQNVCGQIRFSTNTYSWLAHGQCFSYFPFFSGQPFDSAQRRFLLSRTRKMHLWDSPCLWHLDMLWPDWWSRLWRIAFVSLPWTGWGLWAQIATVRRSWNSFRPASVPCWMAFRSEHLPQVLALEMRHSPQAGIFTRAALPHEIGMAICHWVRRQAPWEVSPS